MNRRSALIISILLALGSGSLLAALLITNSTEGDIRVESNPAIRELLPQRGDTVLAQSNVGAILAPGWAGEILQIGGTTIPRDEQRIEPTLNSVIFRPDDGLALNRLPSQEVCASMLYWPVRTPERSITISWCFKVDG